MKFIFSYGNWYKWAEKIKKERSPGICKYLETSYFPPPRYGVVYDGLHVLFRTLSRVASTAVHNEYGIRSERKPWQEEGFLRLGKVNLVKHLTPKLYLKYAV